MSVVPVADVLQGRVAVDQEVTVRGWVRTRRDSKAGISFLAVYDGSCFDPVQAVINNSLPNYSPAPDDRLLRDRYRCCRCFSGPGPEL